MTTAINFTKTAINALAAPDSGRAVYHDKKTPGLMLRVSSTGTKFFAVRRKMGGRVGIITIGRYPDLMSEQSRDRFIQSDELPGFFDSLAVESNTTIRDYLLISLLTGARKSNVPAMRWQDVHIERATWTIPETRSGSPHTVPLVPAAIAMLGTGSDDDNVIKLGKGRHNSS